MWSILPETDRPAVKTPWGTSSALRPSTISGVFGSIKHVGVVPNDSKTRDFMDKHVLPQMQGKLKPSYFGNEAELQADSKGLEFGIVFEETESKLTYKLMTNQSDNGSIKLPQAKEKYNSGLCRPGGLNSFSNITLNIKNGEIYKCPPTSYFYTGFITIQSAIDISWIKKANSTFNQPEDINLQLVPRAATSGLLAESPFVRAFIPVQLTIIIVFLVPHILTLIVGEKEKKIKESMQV